MIKRNLKLEEEAMKLMLSKIPEENLDSENVENQSKIS